MMEAQEEQMAKSNPNPSSRRPDPAGRFVWQPGDVKITRRGEQKPPPPPKDKRASNGG